MNRVRSHQRTQRFQSRNGLIWTSLLIDWMSHFLTISIPQRSDLNSSCATAITPSSLFQSRNGLIWTKLVQWMRPRIPGYFNPATVWFEHSRSSNSSNSSIDFNPATVWFEHFFLNRSLYFTYYFNPATVWFEHRGGRYRLMSLSHFNPATVWFERSWFMSNDHNICGISIPQRSDLNSRIAWPTQLAAIYFNPATVWFEQLCNNFLLQQHQYFNPATVWFERKSHAIEVTRM